MKRREISGFENKDQSNIALKYRRALSTVSDQKNILARVRSVNVAPIAMASVITFAVLENSKLFMTCSFL
jgi:hypothetical protein